MKSDVGVAQDTSGLAEPVCKKATTLGDGDGLGDGGSRRVFFLSGILIRVLISILVSTIVRFNFGVLFERYGQLEDVLWYGSGLDSPVA